MLDDSRQPLHRRAARRFSPKAELPVGVAFQPHFERGGEMAGAARRILPQREALVAVGRGAVSLSPKRRVPRSREAESRLPAVIALGRNLGL